MSKNKRPQITTEDVAPEIDADIDIASTIAKEDIERPDLAAVTDSSITDPVTLKYIQDLAFMEEEVTFVVAKTKDKNEPNPILAGNNGNTKPISLGVVVKMARKFLDSIINTVTETSTQEYMDDAGLKQTRILTHSTPSLSIQIIDDPSMLKGREWFAARQYGRL